MEIASEDWDWSAVPDESVKEMLRLAELQLDDTIRFALAAERKRDLVFTERFEMRATPNWVQRVDDWRRLQPDIPSRGEAIRRLVEAALSRNALEG